MPSVRNIHAPEHPWAHGAGEIGRDVAGQQRADREAEGDRQADIAEVERRRMEREADVLQQRVEPLPLRRRHGSSRSNGLEESSRKA